jgi:hypothetical protein
MACSLHIGHPQWIEGVLSKRAHALSTSAAGHHQQRDQEEGKAAGRHQQRDQEEGKGKARQSKGKRLHCPGFVESLTECFGIPKGNDDIRLVYDGLVSGLNLTIWVPRFFLPTIRTHLRAADENMFMADMDIGEMFLNFILHKDLRALAGMDLSHYFKEEKDGLLWETWQRAAMVLWSSPFQCIQAMGMAEEVI